MALALVPALGVAPATSAAARPAYPSTTPLDNISPALMPLGVSPRPVTVVAEMAGDPVAVTDARSKLSEDQKDQQRYSLKTRQADAERQVQVLGGTVLGDYQSAYNGIKVRIAGTSLGALAAIPNVVGVRPVQVVTPDNVHGVPLVHAPQVWGGSSHLHGEGIKIAVIDTGIDYTHADFGGPGTPEAYQTALATDTAPPDPNLVGPNAPKVKGGIDLVGDTYNADPTSPAYQPVPHPDPNPLDCADHGTHTSGTAAGFGVLSSGATYHGAYTTDTISSNSWNVGPGVAPLADLYAVRVFGCAGSSDVVVDAIDWAVKNNMDVINMSLGSTFGSADTPDAKAASNAAEDGVIVVASAGNAGPAPYVTGSPATSSGAISVAASDPTSTFAGANLALSTGTTIQAIEANGVSVAGKTLPVKVVYSGTPHDAAHIALGCSAAQFSAGGVTGALAVVKRGSCARVAKAIYGEQAGAAAVLMVNNADSFPPFEGSIDTNPDTNTPFHVTIPFLGTPSTKGPALVAADGGTAALSDVALTNPTYLAPASFTSGGPRSGDSALKPDVTAPGVSIASAGMGTGNGPAVMSGTSMAAPHTAGLAALVRQAHPDWDETQYWRAAVVNTADPAQVTGYSTPIAGSGLVQADNAVATRAVALGDHNTATLSYGYAELSADYARTKNVTVKNFSSAAATFDVATERDAGSPHSVGLGQAVVTVPAGGEATVAVNLQVPAGTAGDSSAFHDVSGLVKLTPRAGNNNDVTLRVPYYLVPQALSNIRTSLDTRQLTRSGSATATTTNQNGVIAGNADWYAWGLSGTRKENLAADNLRAVGVQSFPGAGALAFAVSSYKRWSNAAAYEFDIFVDVNNDGKDDYVIAGADLGGITSGSANGVMASAVVDLRTSKVSIHYLADAPTDSSTLVLPADFSQLCRPGSPCLNGASPRLTYHAASFDQVTGTSDSISGSAAFNPFNPSISTGMFDTIAPGASATEPVTIDTAEWAKTPTQGLMVISHDNRSGPGEAQLIRVDGSGDQQGDNVGGNS